MHKELVIYGAGGFAREVAWLVESCNRRTSDNHYKVVCFVDDSPAAQAKEVNNVPVVSLERARETFPEAKIIGGIGNPKARQHLMEKATALGFSFESIIHPGVDMSDWIKIGSGTVICAGNILTTNIILGDHVQINLDCTIGHDVVMGDYTTLAPGVHVSGRVHLRRRVYVGTGAVIINGSEQSPLIIGDDAVIGAGACVNKPVPEGVTVVGVPAKPLVKG